MALLNRKYEQSLAVLDTQTGVLADFPDPRTVVRAHQTLYSGLAFSRDGSHIYASMASLTDPVGDSKGATATEFWFTASPTGRSRRSN